MPEDQPQNDGSQQGSEPQHDVGSSANADGAKIASDLRGTAAEDAQATEQPEMQPGVIDLGAPADAQAVDVDPQETNAVKTLAPAEFTETLGGGSLETAAPESGEAPLETVAPVISESETSDIVPGVLDLSAAPEQTTETAQPSDIPATNEDILVTGSEDSPKLVSEPQENRTTTIPHNTPELTDGNQMQDIAVKTAPEAEQAVLTAVNEAAAEVPKQGVSKIAENSSLPTDQTEKIAVSPAPAEHEEESESEPPDDEAEKETPGINLPGIGIDPNNPFSQVVLSDTLAEDEDSQSTKPVMGGMAPEPRAKVSNPITPQTPPAPEEEIVDQAPPESSTVQVVASGEPKHEAEEARNPAAGDSLYQLLEPQKQAVQQQQQEEGPPKPETKNTGPSAATPEKTGQSDAPVIDPRIKEIFAEKGTALSEKADADAKDGFEHETVAGKEKRRSKEKKDLRQFSRFSKFLQIGTSLALGVFLLATTLFIGGSALEKQVVQHENMIEAFGETKIKLSSGDSYYIKGKHPFFGGENISIENGSATITFEEGNQIRLRDNTEISIRQIYPHPVISMKEGELWVYGNRDLHIAFERSIFYTRTNSARFSKVGDRITATSYLHPLFTELAPAETEKKAFFAIPSKKRIVFAENSIPRALPELHLSKLKKEVHFSQAEQDSWANQNIVEDNRYTKELAENLKLKGVNSHLTKGILASIQEIAVIFPEKKRRDASADIGERIDSFITELVSEGKPFSVNAVELSEAGIDQALVASNLVAPNRNLISTTEELQDEARKRNLNNAADRIIAQNSLAMLEDALEHNDVDLAATILENMVQDWGTIKRSEKNKILLDLYREIIADLFRRHLNIVTPAILHASTRLDSIAISWGRKQMAVINTLEVIEKNQATADIFLEKSKLDMARNLLDINEALFSIRPTTELNASYEALQNRQLFLREKLGVFKIQGWMTKEELFNLLRKRENAKRILSFMQEEERKLLEMNQIIEEKIPLGERIREDFLKNKLLIISMIGYKDEDARVVEIIEAKLPDGQTFSGEYLPEFEVIRNVQLDGEEGNGEIDNELKLNKLVSTIEALRISRINNSGEDLRELRTNPLPKLEEDPVAKMDPIVIEVTKRLTQAVLAQKGFNVLLKDILITSPTTLRVINVEFEPTQQHLLEFDLNNDTKQVSNAVIRPENLTVYTESLDTIAEDAIDAIDDFQARIDQQERVAFALISAGIKINENNIRYTPTGIHFQSARYQDWTLSGLADADRRIFIDITRGGKGYQKNIPFDSLSTILSTDWAEEESIKNLDIEDTVMF